MATYGDHLVLTDFLSARLSVLDLDDRPVAHLYENPAAPRRGNWPDAWPNARASDGTIVRPALRPEVLNSPHAVAFDLDGNLFITEWLLGGRYTKLARRS